MTSQASRWSREQEKAACQARRMCMEIRASDAFRAGSTRDHASRIMSAPSLRPMRLNKGALRVGACPVDATSKRWKNKISVENRNQDDIIHSETRRNFDNFKNDSVSVLLKGGRVFYVFLLEDSMDFLSVDFYVFLLEDSMDFYVCDFYVFYVLSMYTWVLFLALFKN
ncbi:hypothetical protein CEXT_470921 [Caerostris extrusa]|uniref:Uncharacterized protein n=1 Tax=Caerostris extrusa TaxID=172846 RepID=A0AAV4XW77_CAEEX|nr:hypothetical protein CEXT_470921 [Caerostris extrusa]